MRFNFQYSNSCTYSCLYFFKCVLQEIEIAWLFGCKRIRALMETGISSSIVTFGTSKQNGSRNKLWYLILSQGSQYDGAIDGVSFQNSVLEILNSDHIRMSTLLNHHHESGCCFILIIFHLKRKI